LSSWAPSNAASGPTNGRLNRFKIQAKPCERSNDKSPIR
jgi:hypothetical protein